MNVDTIGTQSDGNCFMPEHGMTQEAKSVPN